MAVTIRKIALALVWSLLLAQLALAQDDDVPRSETMPINAVVSDSITDVAFYDWWIVQVAAGETLVVEMRAGPTLAPLVGLLDPSGTLVARSEDGVLGGAVRLEHTAATTGEHIVVATRVGNREGNTTGTYELAVRYSSDLPTRSNPYQQVTFRCDRVEVTNVATLQFAEDIEQYNGYIISVYGLDAFVPMIRLELENMNVTDCSRDPRGMEGDTVTLPGLEPLTAAGPVLDHVAQLKVVGTTYPGPVTLTVGSADGAPGHFVVVVQGFQIEPVSDRDYVQIGQGPLAARRPLKLYMVSDKRSRLDPALSLPTGLPAERALACDDAGGRRCRALPSAEGLRIAVTSSGEEVVGGRFDAGLLLAAGAPQVLPVELGSFQRATSGPYALVLLGELPPRDLP